MGDDDAIVGQRLGEVEQALCHIIIGLAAFGPEVPVARVALAGGGNRHLAGDFGVKAAFEIAKGNLHQPLVVMNVGKGDIESGAHALHGFTRPPERGGEPVEGRRVDPFFFQKEAQQRAVGIGLFLPARVERDVAATLVAALEVPVGFAVAREIEVRPLD